MIGVEPISEATRRDVDRFVRAEPRSLFYQSAAYRELISLLLEVRDVTLVAREPDGAIVGVLPLLEREGPYGTLLNSLPYYGSNGGVIATTDEARAALCAEYGRQALGPGALGATLIPNPWSDAIDEVPHNLTDERIVQYTPIARATEEGILASVDSSARRNIGKARRAGFRAQRDASQLRALWELHDQNIRAIGGRPKDPRFFELVGSRLNAGEDYDLWVARLDNEVAAAVLIFYWNTTAEYFTPAIDQRYRAEQPLALLLVEAMTAAAARGIETWNWGGTWLSQESLFRFKRKWGATEQRYTYLVQLNDERVLSLPRDEILRAYPDFYVAPFSALKEAIPSPSS